MELVVADAADEAFLLDLLNTTPVVDGTVRDELADSVAARRWMRERGIAATKVETAALVEVRSILQKVVRGEARATALKPFVAGVALRPVVGTARIGLANRDGRRTCERGQGGAGVGRPADIEPRAPAAMCEQRVPAVPGRPEQAQHREVVFDGHLRQPDEGTKALSPCARRRGLSKPPRPQGNSYY